MNVREIVAGILFTTFVSLAFASPGGLEPPKLDTHLQRGWDCGEDNNCEPSTNPRRKRECYACCDTNCGGVADGCQERCDGDPRPGGPRDDDA